jgi:hypothetical protein
MRDKFVFLPSKDVPTSHEVLLKKVLSILTADKAAHKKAESDALGKLAPKLAAKGDKHAPLLQYEKEHLLAGADWPTVKHKLQSARDTATAILVTDFWDAENNRGTAQVEGMLKGKATGGADDRIAKLGTVFLGDARFTDLRPQPKGLPHKVYVLGRFTFAGVKKLPKLEQDPTHTKSHFVWLPNSETYVRRFVTRGLNHADIINIAAGAALRAPLQTVGAVERETTAQDPKRHDVDAGDDLSEAQQILSHTRGWQKRYISTGVSSRPVYSTRGSQFMSLYGTAIIDMAKVDPATIFDIHAPIAIDSLLGWQATTVTSARNPASPAKDLAGEEFLALRDVLRTRELLIKFQVPRGAVQCQLDGKRIVGFGTNDFRGPDRLLNALSRWNQVWPYVKGEPDVLNYKGANSMYWLFILVDTAVNARWVYDNFRGRYDGRLLLNRYVMPASLPGWK